MVETWGNSLIVTHHLINNGTLFHPTNYSLYKQLITSNIQNDTLRYKKLFYFPIDTLQHSCSNCIWSRYFSIYAIFQTSVRISLIDATRGLLNQQFIFVKLKSLLRKLQGWNNDFIFIRKEYMYDIQPRIFSNIFPFSFMTYYRICNKIDTFCATSRAGIADHTGPPEFTRWLSEVVSHKSYLQYPFSIHGIPKYHDSRCHSWTG